MGGVAVVPALEEAGGRQLSEWFKGWFTHSGEAQLKSLGPHGEFTADLLKKYEQFSSSNKSYIRNSIKQVFDAVPEQHHEDVHKFVLGKPNNLPSQYLQQAQKLETIKNVIETKAQQSGQHVSINGKRTPFLLHPDGPQVQHPDVLKPNNVVRRQAINEIALNQGVSNIDASKILDNQVRSQMGRNGVAHVAFPETRITTGLLPYSERWQSYGEKAAERISQNVMFGPQDQQLQGVVEAVRRSRGTVSANTLADFLDVFFKESDVGAWRSNTGVLHKSAYTPTQDAERILHKVTGYIQTSRIALPHSTQLINTILNDGLRNTLAGIREHVTDWRNARDFVVNSGALEEDLQRTLRQAVEGQPSLFEKMFHQPGFQWIRARQVEISALAGKHEAIDAAQRVLRGDTRAENTLKRLGVNVAEFKRTRVLTDQMKQQAAYNAAKQAMFFRSALNTPFRREAGPLGRLSYAYSHYHFNMFRTIKNALVNSYKEAGLKGVAAWTAKLGIIFPIAGELVQVAENGMYRKKLNEKDISPTGIEPLDMYLNALAHASAFGVMYSVNRANKETMITNIVVGPIAGTGINVASDVTKAIVGQKTRIGTEKHDWRPVERDVLRHIPVVGPIVSGTVLPYEDKEIHAPRRPTRSHKFEEEGNIFY